MVWTKGSKRQLMKPVGNKQDYSYRISVAEIISGSIFPHARYKAARTLDWIQRIRILNAVRRKNTVAKLEKYLSFMSGICDKSSQTCNNPAFLLRMRVVHESHKQFASANTDC